MFIINDKETARKAYEAIAVLGSLNDSITNGIVAQIKRSLRQWTHNF